MNLAAEVKQNQKRIAELSELGVSEIVLILSAPDTQASIAELEDFAQTVIRQQ